jgi:hypothetical protein
MSEDFLSFLVDETLRLQKSGEVELSSLELKLNDYQLSFLKGEFIPLSQVLRFSTPFGILDIPVNWSVFSLEGAQSSDQLITEEDDKDYLLKVLKTAWNPELKKLLITHADGFCYIVGLKAGEDYYIHDILNPQELLKAA